MSVHPGQENPPPYGYPQPQPMPQPQLQQPIINQPINMQQTMMNQQQNTTNIVVVNQPQQEGQKLILGPISGHRTWTTDLFGCCEDMGSCCYVACCPTLALWTIAAKLGENICVAECVPGGTILLRTRLRTLGGIRGSICGDYCAVTCCPLCVICQMDRELKAML